MSSVLVVCGKGRNPSAPTIFVVTVLEEEKGCENIRTWGWFPDLASAEKSLLENHTDMFEAGYYDLAVIEEFEPGLIPMARSERWFRATYVDGQYSPMVTATEKPAAYKQTIGFGMG